MTRRTHALTLVEVLIALVVLAIGVMAVAQLQVSSLQFSSQAEQIKTSTQVAEAEVDWRRQTEITTGTGMACESFLPDGYTCAVDVNPCNAVGGTSSFTCESGLVSPIAHEIVVVVTGPRTQPFSLRTVTTGNFVAGVEGDGSTFEPPTDTGDDGTADDGTGDDGTVGDGTGDDGTTDDDPRPCLEYAGKSGNCKKWAD